MPVKWNTWINMKIFQIFCCFLFNLQCSWYLFYVLYISTCLSWHDEFFESLTSFLRWFDVKTRENQHLFCEALFQSLEDSCASLILRGGHLESVYMLGIFGWILFGMLKTRYLCLAKHFSGEALWWFVTCRDYSYCHFIVKLLASVHFRWI